MGKHVNSSRGLQDFRVVLSIEVRRDFRKEVKGERQLIKSRNIVECDRRA